MTFLMPDMETLSLFFQRLAVWDKPVSNIVAYAVILYGIPVILFHLADGSGSIGFLGMPGGMGACWKGPCMA